MDPCIIITKYYLIVLNVSNVITFQYGLDPISITDKFARRYPHNEAATTVSKAYQNN